MIELTAGLDFRKPEYRREVFLRFYEFHLKYNAHPGAVYYALPYLFKALNMTREQQLWFCYITGCSENVITSWLIYNKCDDPHKIDSSGLEAYWTKDYKRFGWDTDRRYFKAKFIQCVYNYIDNLNGKTQEQFFDELCNTGDKYQNFRNVWAKVTTDFFTMGRMSSFGYLEYLRIQGLNLDCDNLYFEDISGSKSHRNGLCTVLSRDDLIMYDKNPYTKEDISQLVIDADGLFSEAQERIDHKDVSLFTFESALCTYKGWHRKNRRYPNCYNDMFHDRIKYAERQWGAEQDFAIFWQMRQECLPKHLRLEDNPYDIGLKPFKQNHYLNTGQVIMMNHEWDCFENDYNKTVEQLQNA